MASIPETTLTAIFTAAAGATSWKRTTLGLTTEITRGCDTWVVRLPPEGEGGAFIDGCYGYGGSESAYAEATWSETIRIVDAALAATRLH
ncbi:hypothetical protein [Streptomyces sp. TE5632]